MVLRCYGIGLQSSRFVSSSFKWFWLFMLSHVDSDHFLLVTYGCRLLLHHSCLFSVVLKVVSVFRRCIRLFFFVLGCFLRLESIQCVCRFGLFQDRFEFHNFFSAL